MKWQGAEPVSSIAKSAAVVRSNLAEHGALDRSAYDSLLGVTIHGHCGSVTSSI
jgi:hypothetical protein